MTSGGLLTNWWIWCVHVAALIGAGVLAAQLSRWRHPHSRLRFFQLLLAVCLLLPFIEPRKVHRATVASGGSVQVVTQVEGPVTGAANPPADWSSGITFLLIAGAGIRLAALALGLMKLRSLRRRGRVIEVEGLGAAEVREVSGLDGPAAFGWLRPVILLPEGMPAGPLREAALRHELQHVLRGDWLENMFERAAASLLWFHPMVWWLLERIHLAREQSVDHEVAGAGKERDSYLQSLLTSARLANPAALPAAGFVRRRRHLVERVAFLTKETSMSIRKTAASAAVAILFSGAALTLAGIYLPLQLSAQESADSPFHWVRPSSRGEGTVQVEATLNSQGEVMEARVLSGPDEFRRQALQSVLSWRYKKEAAERRVVTVTIEFRKSDAPVGGVVGGIIGGVPGPPPAPPPPAVERATFTGVDYSGLSTDLQQKASATMSGLRTGQKLTNEQIDQLRNSLTALDPKLRLGVSMRKESGDQFTLRLHVSEGTVFGSAGRISVGGNVQDEKIIHRVDPEYPPLARQARIQGAVRFQVVIGKDGSVEQIQLVSGHPLLVTPAQEALRQWKYKPTLLNGQPVPVQTTVEVNFQL